LLVRRIFIGSWLPLLGPGWSAAACAAALEEVPFSVRLDTPHPWRGPFSLERIGQPLTARVTASRRPPAAEFVLAARLKGKEVGRYPITFPGQPPFFARQALGVFADELVFSSRSPGGELRELVRQTVQPPELEAEAIARPESIINPIDLNTVLVPAGWLLLGPGQSATLELAALRRAGDPSEVQLSAYFESVPERALRRPITLPAGQRVRTRQTLPAVTPGRDRDALVVELQSGTRTLWRKTIPVMHTLDPPRHPRFGATYERLRYDAPISIRDPASGTYSTMAYETAWRPDLRDVVIWLPSGARFVFWRGSSYIPFWAGRHNTGACYEWAEIISQPEGAVDCVEPLMDKELRYGRVEIIESTAARVHVRWSYQSTDFNYKVWGDEAVEDYYFYPDGFGTRTLNLRADPKNEYELSEFIILTPQGVYPFEVLPEVPVEALWLDGRKRAFRFPNPTAAEQKRAPGPADVGGGPALYRLRLSAEEELSAVYFSPRETRLPPVVFAPFFDAGEMVTPCYWGSHWPLARGNSTGWAIDARIQFTPCHNSIMSWAGARPAPLRTSQVTTLDTLGRSRPMELRTWVWLIGMTGAADQALLDRAKSFAGPPSVALSGARPDFESYMQERRAIRIVPLERDVRVTFRSGFPCVNPVFEWIGAPAGRIQVWLGDRVLDAARFAWDGRTLWLDATIERPTELRIAFGQGEPRSP
jgi:hypothetical protein